MKFRLRLIVLTGMMLLCITNVHAQTSRLHGRVVDSRTGEPIAKATVSIRDRKIEARTADDGEFELTDVAPGEIELYVTTVGDAPVRKKVDVSASTTIDIELTL